MVLAEHPVVAAALALAGFSGGLLFGGAMGCVWAYRAMAGEFDGEAS